MFVTRETSHLDRSPLNEVAPLNIPSMLITRDTSHLEMSALNDVAPLNNPLMSVMSDTSHVLIGPLTTSLQLPSGAFLRHSVTASWSSLEDFGRKIPDISAGASFV